MTLTVFDQLTQGSEEWLSARLGMVTASVVGQLVTPKTIKPANNDTSRTLTETLVAERLTGHIDPFFMTSDMERGVMDEPYARDIYAEHYAPVEEIGFMVRDDWGYSIGYSPDGLVGDDGLIEIKSRKPKIQLRTILTDTVPLANMAQLQCGLLVSGRAWIDYVSYAGGMPLYVKRIEPDPVWHAAIIEAVDQLETLANNMVAFYRTATERMPATVRIDHYADMEMTF